MEIDKDIFNQNLLLTQAYCDLQLQKPFTNNAEVLRTFNPEYNGQPLFKYRLKYRIGFMPVNVWNIDPIDNQNLYDELFENQMMNKINLMRLLDKEVVYQGKILVAEIDQVIRDGISADETDGFIDENDSPPIDTWFYMLRGSSGNRYLFAWIPEQFVVLVNNGIDVNMLNIFNWYNDRAIFEYR